jgi:hypothetical protein
METNTLFFTKNAFRMKEHVSYTGSVNIPYRFVKIRPLHYDTYDIFNTRSEIVTTRVATIYTEYKNFLLPTMNKLSAQNRYGRYVLLGRI